jgi:hypothetical protein
LSADGPKEEDVMRILTPLVVVIAIAVSLLSEEAEAQAGWGSPPEVISSIHSAGVNMLRPKLGLDAAGNAMAIWIETGDSHLGVVVKSARYQITTRTWNAPVTLSDSGAANVDEPQITVDAAGNAVATWTASGGSLGSSRVRAARYSASTNTWTAVPVPGQFSGKALVAGNVDGDAVIVWNELTSSVFSAPVSLQAIRYSVASGTWSDVEPLAATLAVAPVAGDVAIDSAGNVVVVWLGQTTVQVARYDAATTAWSGVVELSAPLDNLAVSPPDLAMSAAGAALVSWSRISTIEAALWPSGGSAWEAAVTVTAVTSADTTRSALDPSGNGMVVWTTNTGMSARQLWASRYDAATSAWSPATSLSSEAFVLGYPSVTLDPLGNAFVAWTQETAPAEGVPLYSARLAASTGAWTLSPGLSDTAQRAFNPDIAVDDAGNALVVWHQTAGAFAATQALRWDATPPAPDLSAIAPGPGTLVITFSLLPHTDPALAATGMQYSLDGGTTWTPTATSSPRTIAGLTDGVIYDLRVRASNSAGIGQSSPELPVRSGSGGDPSNLRVVSRTGNTITFAWVAPAGIVPTGYVIEGGISGQSQILASVATGTATQLTLSVPDGLFFARVVAVRGARRLGQSSALQLSMNAGGLPSAPTNLLGSASGGRLTLSWTNPSNGAPLTGVRLHISGSVLTAIDLPPTESFTFDAVPPGTYTFVLTPLISTVPGDSSNAITLTFPGTCAASPHPPAAFGVSTQDGRVYVDWLPPASGPAVTSYVVSVSGAFTGSFPMTGRTLAVPVAPGTYSVSVAAVGLCGMSHATPAQTVVVP